MWIECRVLGRLVLLGVLAASPLSLGTAVAQQQPETSAAAAEAPSKAPSVASDQQPPTAADQPPAGTDATAVTTGTASVNADENATATVRTPARHEPASAAAAASEQPLASPPAAGAAPPSSAASEPAPAATSAPPPPAPAFALDAPAALARLASKVQADKRDRDAALAVYAARNGRPLWMTPRGPSPEALKLAAAIARADDWGLRAAAFDVPRLEPARGSGPDLAQDTLAENEVRLSLAALKYARHARGGRIEPTQLTKFLDRKAQVYEPRSVLESLAAAAEPGEYLASLNPRHRAFQQLRQEYLTARAKGGPESQRLLANLEQWRWMPDDLGDFHVWVNVPEMLVRVVRRGEVVHTERVIIGKLDTQTPIFSDEMEQVIFHPFWGVPDSIKQNEVLPSLRGSGAILAKHNLRIQAGGRDIDPKAVDWSRTDIKKFHVYQPPGGDNVLGVVKFRFPNKHDVYMHDTPSKSLFKSAVRTYSHGCMRVQNPVRLAELILAEDRRMGPDKVQALTRKDAPENNQVNLARRVPVHITYFTATIDEKGRLATFKDIYGHEERVRLGLEGKMHLIKPVPEPKGPASAEPVGQLAEIKAKESDWVRGAFSGGGFSAGGN